MAAMRLRSASKSSVGVRRRGGPCSAARRIGRHGPAGGDHRLGRDAVPQVRRAADDVALDQRDLGAEPGRVGGRRVAGRAAADDHEPQCHPVNATSARRARRGGRGRRTPPRENPTVWARTTRQGTTGHGSTSRAHVPRWRHTAPLPAGTHLERLAVPTASPPRSAAVARGDGVSADEPAVGWTRSTRRLLAASRRLGLRAGSLLTGCWSSTQQKVADRVNWSRRTDGLAALRADQLAMRTSPGVVQPHGRPPVCSPTAARGAASGSWCAAGENVGYGADAVTVHDALDELGAAPGQHPRALRPHRHQATPSATAASGSRRSSCAPAEPAASVRSPAVPVDDALIGRIEAYYDGAAPRRHGRVPRAARRCSSRPAAASRSTASACRPRWCRDHRRRRHPRSGPASGRSTCPRRSSGSTSSNRRSVQRAKRPDSRSTDTR